MKKIILPAVLFTLLGTAITSCSKDAKAPATTNKNTAVAKTTPAPGNTTTSQNEGYHNQGCGNSGGGH